MSELPRYSHREIKELLDFVEEAAPDEYEFKATSRPKSITATYKWAAARPVMGGPESTGGGMFRLLNDAPFLLLQLLTQLDELMTERAEVTA